ncbi:hypothetical protein PMAYCL1PPCAC_09342, partial [Pristionchus mayeri]
KQFKAVRLPGAPFTPIHIPHLVEEHGYAIDSTNLGVMMSTKIVRKFDSPGHPSIMIKKYLRVFQDKDTALKLRRELNILRNVIHPNVVRVVEKYAVNEENLTEAEEPRQMDSIYTITYYCGVPLSTRIAKGDYMMDTVKRWTRDALNALQYLHNLEPLVIHRDLKPDKLCINESNQLTVVGFSRARADEERKKSITAHRGTDYYMAMEMHVKMRKAYDEKEIAFMPISSILHNFSSDDTAEFALVTSHVLSQDIPTFSCIKMQLLK